MHFCNNCDNMYYIKINEENCNSISYYCRNCGNSDDSLINTSKCILKENITKTDQNFSNVINKYTKMDITLPRINYIKCPNENCESNKSDFNIENREVIYLRYDDTNMKYIYLCYHCDVSWKTDQ